MSQLIAMVFKWLLHKLGLLVIIIAILLAGAWLKAEWAQHRAAQAALEQQQTVLEGLQADLQSIEVAIAADQAEWRRAAADRMRSIWDELEALNHRIVGLEDHSQAARGKYLDLARQAQAARRAANQAKVKLDVLERNYWWWDSYVSPTKLIELQGARATYAALNRTATAAEAARAARRRPPPRFVRDIAALQAAPEGTAADPRRSRPYRVAALRLPHRRRNRKQQESRSSRASSTRSAAPHVATNPREQLISNIRSSSRSRSASWSASC